MIDTRKKQSDAAAVLLLVQKPARYTQKEMLLAKVVLVGPAAVVCNMQFHQRCINYLK